MSKLPQDNVAGPLQAPTWQMRNELNTLVDLALPQTPRQFGERQIRAKWGQDLDPQTAQLVTLDYNYKGHPAQNGVQQGRVASSQSLLQALLSNYQTVADGRFGETLFGLYTPPDVGPTVRIVEKVDELADHGSGNHETYEGIYRQTIAQIYGPQTQIALRPADFKKWVWELELRELYSAYLAQAWPSDDVLLASAPYPLRTSVKAAFVMSAWLQHQERQLTEEELRLALQAAGLPAEQTWEALTVKQLQAAQSKKTAVMASRLKLYRYTATDIWIFRSPRSARVLLYIPGNSSPLHDFHDAVQMRQWVVTQARLNDTKQALAAHFADEDRKDGVFHAGVLTALDGMAIYPRKHRLTKDAGFFNDDGYWDPAEYIDLDNPPSGTDPFAQLIQTMKQAALASVDTIRDDAQVNRDNLSSVVEPIVQWVNRFGPLALFVPGGEGLLGLAGLIDAGYGLDQAVNAETTKQRSEGVTRTVFGLLNALPIIGVAAATDNEVVEVPTLTEADLDANEPSVTPRIAPIIEAPGSTRLTLLRGIGPSVASFSDQVLTQIGKVSAVDDDMLRLMQTGRPPTPLLADTISRFQLDQDLAGQPELFKSRYEILQQSELAWVKLFQREYPGLPKSAIEQMLDRYGVNIQLPPDAMEAMRVFRRMDSKARQYLQHVRLNRAYEGLYLRSVHNTESDTLALHSLRNLPGWPQNLRIDVLDQSVIGRLLDRCGPLDGPDVRYLIRTGADYRHQNLQTDFYAAVLGLLSDDERSALHLTSTDPAGELRFDLGHQALPRSEFMLGLQRMDARLPFEAQGLRGGSYPGTPQAEEMTHEMMRLQLKNIFPEFTNAEADEALVQAGVSAQAHIDDLQRQFGQLNADLSSWIDQAAHDLEDMDVPFLTASDPEAQGLTQAQITAHNVELIQQTMEYEREARSELADEMIAIWQKRAPQPNSHYSGSHSTGFRMNMDFEDFHRLPAVGVHLNDVTELSMRGFHLVARTSLEDFLESFPSLRTLNLEYVDLRLPDANDVLLSTLPPAITRMRHLTFLNLKATQMTFSESTASQLSRLTQLQTLDLSDNPLTVPPLVLGMNNLRRLNLRNTGITSCPIGIMDEPYLHSLDLRDNQIDRIPPAVMSQAISQGQVLLQGNPLTDEDTLLRLVTHRQRSGLNLWLSKPGADYGTVDEWLREGSDAQKQVRRLIWQRLATKPRGPRFLRVMDGLSLTADFLVDYLTLQARVWRLLGEADAAEELWGRLIQDVEVAEVDAENPFASFTELEVRARLYRDWVALGRPFPVSTK